LNTRKTGTFYENAVCKFLEEKGIKILQRNFRCKAGEIDIIGKKEECIIFFEVKYRKSTAYGYAQEAVNKKKQKKICNCAMYYCLQNKEVKQIRYDVVAITGEEIQWIPNAFEHLGYCFL